MFQNCTHAGRGSLWPQCQALAVEMIHKGVHLFLDNVCNRSDGTHEQVGLLDYRHANIAIAISDHPVANNLLEELPPVDLIRQDVVHPAYDLNSPSGHRLLSSGISSAHIHRLSGETPLRYCRLSVLQTSGRPQIPAPPAAPPSLAD